MTFTSSRYALLSYPMQIYFSKHVQDFCALSPLFFFVGGIVSVLFHSALRIGWPGITHFYNVYLFARYSKALQWTDGTVAYVTRFTTYLKDEQLEFCSNIEMCPLTSNSSYGFCALSLIGCDAWDDQGYVCERRIKSERKSQLRLPVFKHSEEFQITPVTTCPFGHVTHTFLSCDLKSTCWGRQTSRGFFCDSSLRPLLPMFLCYNEIDRVPYSLVCDHRPDCMDVSDETFCTFHTCPGASFKCGAKQVNSGKR